MYNRRMALSRLAYRQLGIDVWRRRRPSPQVAEAQLSAPPRQAPAPSRRREPSPAVGRAVPALGTGKARPAKTPVPIQPPVTEEPLENFRVRCFRYGKVFVALAEDAWPQRRFLLDVALAMNGFEAARRRDLAFDWPQPGAGVGGGLGSAGRSFRAFFGHQTRDGCVTLIAGSRVATLLGHDAPPTTCRLEGHVYVAPDAHAAEDKKALWRLIRER